MNRRIVLTAREIECVLAVAGDALAGETLSSGDDPDGDLEAFESGMDKLREMLGNRDRAAARRRRP
jgi:hypothetical protein